MTRHGRRAKALVFDLGLRASAALSRSPLHGVTEAAMHGLGALTLWLQNGRPKSGLDAVADEWQRMFPRPSMVPRVDRDATTVYAEVHARCPLRGTGDVDACYRMMAYDRRMLEHIGGQLVVLDSQSEPGRTHCRVAIRTAGAPTDDLVAAHERTGNR